ncbi:MAG: hypothetical protein A2505_00440 [Deltaproteobacteria bacterium RIFOXYD12_FULL_55_16]|nr:MAG: hypothetical protein A2505_00440 [Deltaproteobacteria bacterium RIFOXYD12_FULL_55_16]
MKHNPLLLLDSSGHFPELVKALQKKNLALIVIRSTAEARRWLEENQCQAILLAGASLQAHGAFLADLQEIAPSVAVIVVASEPSVNDVVVALQAGVVDYLETPVSESLLDLALAKAGVRSQLSSAAQLPVKAGKGCAAIIGNSSAMRQVFSLIKKVCDAETTVLIRGESGTGKELIAQALHYEGVRGAGPFVPVNCGAIPGELLESELFGHEKGAFTHAIRTRLGRFELANGGTVFLDEISEMSPMLQVKLLRVLQEKEFERIGGTKTISSDFRVVAATNRDLEQEVQAGRFREDLYYRLNVIPIEAPPLRERRQDIPLLVEHFVARFNRLRKKKIKGVEEEVMGRFARYAWPGNVRELENMLERMVILAGAEVLSLADLPERLLEVGDVPAERFEEIPGQGFFLNELLADFERRLILQALEQTDWVKNRAAKLLHVNRTTLIEKMKRFKLASSSVEA